MPPYVTPLEPDIELIVVTYLKRTGSRVRDLVGQRVYTVVPKFADAAAEAAGFPLLRVVRFGGGPVRQVPQHLYAPALQLDAYGGSKADARRLIASALAELADMAEHTHTGGVVTGVNIGTARYLPEPDFMPTKPRYVADATVIIHP